MGSCVTREHHTCEIKLGYPNLGIRVKKNIKPREYHSDNNFSLINYTTASNQKLETIQAKKIFAIEQQPANNSVVRALFTLENDQGIENHISVTTLKTLQDNGEDSILDMEKSQMILEGSLKNHLISPLLRAKMVNWMIEVLTTFDLSRNTFFLSVAIMDRYYLKADSTCKESDIHLTGTTCMFIASKLEDVNPLSLDDLYNNIVHRAMSKQTIINKEKLILSTLNCIIPYITLCNIIDIYIEHITYETYKAGYIKTKIEWNIIKIIRDTAMFYSTLISLDYDFLIYLPSLIAKSAIYAISAKLSENVNEGSCHVEFINEFIKLLCGSDETKLIQIEGCAKDIVKLEETFSRKYKGLNNIYTLNFVD